MIKTLMAVAIAGAFAVPMMAQASATGDNMVVAQAGGGGDTGASSRQEGTNPPGAVSPGTPSTATTGTDRETGADRRANPHGMRGSAGRTADRGFDRLDNNHDGYISRDEYGAMRGSAGGSTGTGRMGGMGSAPGKGPGAQPDASTHSESGGGNGGGAGGGAGGGGR